MSKVTTEIEGAGSSFVSDPQAPQPIEQRNGQCVKSDIVEAVARGQVDPRSDGDGSDLLRWVWSDHSNGDRAYPLWNAWQAAAWVMTRDKTLAAKMGGAIELTSMRGPVWLTDRARETCLVWEIEQLQAAEVLGECLGIDAAFAALSKASRNGDLPQMQGRNLDRVWHKCARSVFFHSYDVMQCFPGFERVGLPGRPAGSGKDDEAALLSMRKLIEARRVKTVNEAARLALPYVGADSSNTSTGGIMKRLCGKYMDRAEDGGWPLPKKPDRAARQS